MITGKVYSVIEKNLPSPLKQEIISTADIEMQIPLSQFNGQQIQTKFIYPTNVNNSVQREVNSGWVKVRV